MDTNAIPLFGELVAARVLNFELVFTRFGKPLVILLNKAMTTILSKLTRISEVIKAELKL